MISASKVVLPPSVVFWVCLVCKKKSLFINLHPLSFTLYYAINFSNYVKVNARLKKK